MKKWTDCFRCVMAGAMLAGAGSAWAQEEPLEVEDRVSGTVGVDISSHFISYGFDVWGAGDGWDADPSVFVWGEISWDLPWFTLTGGVWSDNNNNTESQLGGPIQEIDVYIGVSKSFFEDKLNVGVTYQEWFYGSNEEQVLDFSLGFDDSDMLFEGFAFNPSLVYHNRLEGTGLEEGAALVLGIEPAFEIIKSETYPVTLAIPVNVAFGVPSIAGDDDLYGEDGFEYAYASIGAALSVPVAFIPEEYGAWTAGASATFYTTEDDMIGNPDDEFVVGMLSLSMGF